MAKEKEYLNINGYKVLLSDCWRTPGALFDLWNEEYDFQTDVSACSDDTLCPNWLGLDHPDEIRQDSLVAPLEEWTAHGSIWNNPPYSQEGGPLLQWTWMMSDAGLVVPTVGLVPATPATEWFERCMNTAAQITFYRSRIAFVDPMTGMPAKSPRYDNATVHWHPGHRGPPEIVYLDTPK